MKIGEEAGAEDDEVVTIPCPHCRKAIWEESVVCEHCGRYVSQEDSPRPRPWWLVVGVLAGLACVYLWLRR